MTKRNVINHEYRGEYRLIEGEVRILTREHEMKSAVMYPVKFVRNE